MRRISGLVVLSCLLLAWAAPVLAAPGSVDGRVERNGQGIGGVRVTVVGADATTVTDQRGYFTLPGLAPGTYELSFTLGPYSATLPGVVVADGSRTEVEQSVDWDVIAAETVTVYTASRKSERIVDAPQAVTVISEQQIEEQAAHGQVVKLLEFTPGAEVTQSGIYDYNFNTRGFNSSLNRRVATLIDGRDPSVPFLGAQEWAAVSFPLDDVASLELVRGPSAALYGANASSGVINITTKQPRFSEGGLVRLTGGELSTFNADLRYATEIGAGWYAKVVAGVRDSGDFSVSRNGAAEYSQPCSAMVTTDCLPQEAVPLARVNDNEITFGALRFDKYFSGGDVFTVEGGTADVAGPLFQTGIGRVQLVDVKRPWARVNYSTDHFNVLAYYNKRDAPRQLALASGSNLVLMTDNFQVEGRTNWEFADGRGRIVGGASYTEENIDTYDPNTGRQSLTFAPIDSDSQALYAQLDFSVNDLIELVFAARWDDSTLHDAQFSPKGGIVFTPHENHTLRLTYTEAFQVPNYSEFFLFADVAPPVDLSAIEAGVCTPFGVDCGFDAPVRTLALGNESLEVEEIATIELGYSGILNRRTFLTFDLYTSQNENFITDLIPIFDSQGNRVNPAIQAYMPPAGLPAPVEAALIATLQGALGPQYAILSNDPSGAPILAARTYTNFGDVDTTGADLGVNHYFDDRWTLSFTYSWFDFDIKDDTSPLAGQLIPNTPEHKASAGVSYRDRRFDATLAARWVDDFRWVVGPFQGDVESYTTVDLNGEYRFDERWSVGVTVANLFDDEHWESFGGDLLGRRALGNVAFRWE